MKFLQIVPTSENHIRNSAKNYCNNYVIIVLMVEIHFYLIICVFIPVSQSADHE